MHFVAWLTSISSSFIFEWPPYGSIQALISVILSKTYYTSKHFCLFCSGNPSYMAPEVLQGKPYSLASDLWAVGCVLYQLFTGKSIINCCHRKYATAWLQNHAWSVNLFNHSLEHIQNKNKCRTKAIKKKKKKNLFYWRTDLSGPGSQVGLVGRWDVFFFLSFFRSFFFFFFFPGGWNNPKFFRKFCEKYDDFVKFSAKKQLILHDFSKIKKKRNLPKCKIWVS